MNIVLKATDGSIAIMTLVAGADKEEAIRKFQESHPDYIDHYEFKGKLPASREFRDAWTFGTARITIDKAKARAIHMERVRYARNEALDKLDKEQMRWLADPLKIQELEIEKQRLRDLPANVQGLDWPDELERE